MPILITRRHVRKYPADSCCCTFQCCFFLLKWLTQATCDFWTGRIQPLCSFCSRHQAAICSGRSDCRWVRAFHRPCLCTTLSIVHIHCPLLMHYTKYSTHPLSLASLFRTSSEPSNTVLLCDIKTLWLCCSLCGTQSLLVLPISNLEPSQETCPRMHNVF
jgi:hypothetical protein